MEAFTHPFLTPAMKMKSCRCMRHSVSIYEVALALSKTRPSRRYDCRHRPTWAACGNRSDGRLIGKVFLDITISRMKAWTCDMPIGNGFYLPATS